MCTVPHACFASWWHPPIINLKNIWALPNLKCKILIKFVSMSSIVEACWCQPCRCCHWVDVGEALARASLAVDWCENRLFLFDVVLRANRCLSTALCAPVPPFRLFLCSAWWCAFSIFERVACLSPPCKHRHRHLHDPVSKVLTWGFKTVVLDDRLGSEGIISHAHVELRLPSVGACPREYSH